MSELAITYRGTVYPWQCDHMGHMNVMWYVGKFDEASWQLLATLGFTRIRTRQEGVGAVAVEQHINYKRELLAGDIVTIRSTVVDIKDKALHLFHEMRNDETGEIAATMTVVGIHIDVHARKAQSLPEDIRSRAFVMISRHSGPSVALLDQPAKRDLYAEASNPCLESLV
jgi:acyl-CoA thioester hydrolase